MSEIRRRHQAERLAQETKAHMMPEFLRPHAGWFLAAAGSVAGYIIGELHAPLWLAFVTFFLFLASAAFWPWIERHRKWKFAFWGSIVGYVLVAGICTAMLRDDAGRRLEKKIDRLQESRDQDSLGLRYGSEALSSRYPNGYVIFSLSYKDRIVFHKGRSATDFYAFDWDRVKYLSNTSDSFTIQMPDIHQKTGGEMHIIDTEVSGPKKVGWFFTFHSDGIEKIAAVCEVMDADEQGIVFLIGFMPLH